MYVLVLFGVVAKKANTVTVLSQLRADQIETIEAAVQDQVDSQLYPLQYEIMDNSDGQEWPVQDTNNGV